MYGCVPWSQGVKFKIVSLWTAFRVVASIFAHTYRLLPFLHFSTLKVRCSFLYSWLLGFWVYKPNSQVIGVTVRQKSQATRVLSIKVVKKELITSEQ